MFVSFDRRGRGFFVEDTADGMRLLVRRGGAVVQTIPLGPRVPLDFAQDIRFAADGRAVIAFWSGRVVVVDPTEGGEWTSTSLQLPRPPDCARAIFYTAFIHRDHVWATLACGATLTRVRLR